MEEKEWGASLIFFLFVWVYQEKMPPNQKGGARYKKFKKGSGTIHEERLVECNDEEGEFYAYVKSTLGQGRFMVDIVNEKGVAQTDCLAILRGNMKKQKWRHFVAVGGLVLVTTLLDGNKDKEKFYIVKTYDASDVRQLTRMKKVCLKDLVVGKTNSTAVGYEGDVDGEEEETRSDAGEHEDEEEEAEDAGGGGWEDFDDI